MVKQPIHDDKEWFLNLFGNSADIYMGCNYIRGLMKSIENHILYNRCMQKSASLDYCMLEYLATQGNSTLYRIKDDLGVRFSSAWNSYLNLERNGLIRIASTEEWRTGLQRKLLGITSIGLAPIVAFKDHRLGTTSFKDYGIDGMDVRLVVRHPTAQEWFEYNVKEGYLSLIAQKNAHLPFFDFLFQNWNAVQEAFNNPDPNEKKKMKRTLECLFGTDVILHIFDELWMSARYCIWRKSKEEGKESVFSSKSHLLLEDSKTLKDFRSGADRLFTVAYFYALSLLPITYGKSGNFPSVRDTVLFRTDDLCERFLTEYKPVLREEIEHEIKKYLKDLAALTDLSNFLER